MENIVSKLFNKTWKWDRSCNWWKLYYLKVTQASTFSFMVMIKFVKFFCTTSFVHIILEIHEFIWQKSIQNIEVLSRAILRSYHFFDQFIQVQRHSQYLNLRMICWCINAKDSGYISLHSEMSRISIINLRISLTSIHITKHRRKIVDFHKSFVKWFEAADFCFVRTTLMFGKVMINMFIR